ncbi:MAG TPA: hypothetical protein VFN68_09085 [Acidimicrobiales bacterium]|nr:hypothetical protein [Acidimicrobiales bacterium]
MSRRPVAQASSTAASAKDKDSDKKPKKRRFRGAFGRTMMKVPFLRRWYIRRVLKFIDKSRASGRKLPEGMADTARYLSRVPKHQREKAFEDAILANQSIPDMGREMRRAASRQRRSGKNDNRYRPGLPPGTVREARRKAR